MSTCTKSADALVKAVGGDDGGPEGSFEALVSVFGNVDSYGDVVLPGAFTDTLAAWAAKGASIPVVWAHQWADPFSHIGHVTEAVETDEGLVVKASLDMENPTAAQVYRLLKSGRISQFSFGFDVLDGGWGVRKGEDGETHDVYELRALDLIEVGPCLRGVNTETELLAIKGQPPTKTPPARAGANGSHAAAESITTLRKAATVAGLRDLLERGER